MRDITIYVFFVFNHVTVLHPQKFKFLKSDADEAKQKYHSGPSSTSSIKVFLILAVCDFFFFFLLKTNALGIFFTIFSTAIYLCTYFFLLITLKFLLSIIDYPFSA